eukprot:15365708-Ditylum_brightwellii.AAC.1
MYKQVQDRGYTSYTHWQDNEAPTGIKQYNTQNTTTYQLVPPNVHRTNATERAIRTSKKHYKAILASVDPTFPMFDQKLSACASLEGVHDYNVHPIAPFGTEVTVHEAANQ